MMLMDFVGAMLLTAVSALVFATAFLLVAFGISLLRESRRDGK